MSKPAPSPLLAGILDLAVDAGSAIMAIYGHDPQIRWKEDTSPVTEADLLAEAIILAGLERLAPEIPAISEERVAAGVIPPPGNRYFLIDPLDGTKEFLSRNGEFTVNIALIENDKPVLGIVFAPALPRLFWAATETGAFEASLTAEGQLSNPCHRRLSAAKLAKGRLRAVASRSHRDGRTEDWLKSHNISEIVCAGSSLKFCLIAAGEADVYPRFGPTMEWDTAAGHAILSAAGGKVLTEAGEALAYGKRERGFTNPSFIASGPITLS
jgi:3'(2'), 5'-bisphosphate nucleotidase